MTHRVFQGTFFLFYVGMDNYSPIRYYKMVWAFHTIPIR